MGYEADDVCLDGVVAATGQEVCDPPRPHAVRVEEVPSQDAERLLRFFISEERPKLLDHIDHSGPVVANHPVEIVGVLVLAPAVEGERLEHDEGPRAADPDLTGRLLAEERRPSMVTRRRS